METENRVRTTEKTFRGSKQFWVRMWRKRRRVGPWEVDLLNISYRESAIVFALVEFWTDDFERHLDQSGDSRLAQLLR